MPNFDPDKTTKRLEELEETVALLVPLIPIVQPLLDTYSKDVAGNGMTLIEGTVIPQEELNKSSEGIRQEELNRALEA